MNLEEFRTKLFGMSGLATVEKAFELYSELEAENERLKEDNKNLKEQLKKDGEWLCNGNEQNNGIDANQSWGIFG